MSRVVLAGGSGFLGRARSLPFRRLNTQQIVYEKVEHQALPKSSSRTMIAVRDH